MSQVYIHLQCLLFLFRVFLTLYQFILFRHLLLRYFLGSTLCGNGCNRETIEIPQLMFTKMGTFFNGHHPYSMQLVTLSSPLISFLMDVYFHQSRASVYVKPDRWGRPFLQTKPSYYRNPSSLFSRKYLHYSPGICPCNIDQPVNPFNNIYRNYRNPSP